MFIYIGKAKKNFCIAIFRFLNQTKPQFVCPICLYKGPFEDIRPSTGLRKHAKCPNCKSLERHRLQYIVIQKVLADLNSSRMRMLHFAPESFFHNMFVKSFRQYETADLYMENVNHKVDIQNLPFADSSYDFVFASHVLEHIKDDRKAISEIRRILKPGGIAILPVPLIAGKTTVEYPEPNPNEALHVRAPGFDYFQRYSPHFSRVDIYSSDSFPVQYQLFVYEDRSIFPNKKCPLRPSMSGEKHTDIIPVCYV
jgi:SAM-dependent methyltransferase